MKTKIILPSICWIANSSREILPVSAADDMLVIDRHGQAKSTTFVVGDHVNRHLYEIFTTRHYASLDVNTQVFTNNGAQTIEALFNSQSGDGNIFIEGFSDKLNACELKAQEGTLLIKPEYLDLQDVENVLLKCIVNYKEGRETIIPRPIFSMLPWIIKNLESISGHNFTLEYDNLTFPCEALIKPGAKEDGHLITICKNDPVLMYEISIEGDIAGIVCDNILII